MDDNIKLTLESIVTHAEDVVCAKIDSHVVMMSVEDGLYYDINEAGGHIWSMIEKPLRISELCHLLRKTFDVAPVRCETDVMDFLQGLAERRLLRVISPMG